MATIAGIVPRPLETDDIGRMDISQIKRTIRPDDPHYPKSKLILLENSYGNKYGAPQPPEYFTEVRVVADEFRLVSHLDGARIFNASVALDINVTEITRHVDSVSFCLSKGLCAPIGSLLCGSEVMIFQARRARKVLGGGMRQAGIIASAGIIALNEMVSRLADDHKNAKYLAQKLTEIPGIEIEVAKIRTNILFFELSPDIPCDAQEVVDDLWRFQNIRLDIAGHRRFRALTHYWVGQQEVDLLVDALHQAISRLSSREGANYPGHERTC
jgi:threonine aldolase